MKKCLSVVPPGSRPAGAVPPSPCCDSDPPAPPPTRVPVQALARFPPLPSLLSLPQSHTKEPGCRAGLGQPASTGGEPDLLSQQTRAGRAGVFYSSIFLGIKSFASEHPRASLAPPTLLCCWQSRPWCPCGTCLAPGALRKGDGGGVGREDSKGRRWAAVCPFPCSSAMMKLPPNPRTELARGALVGHRHRDRWGGGPQ